MINTYHGQGMAAVVVGSTPTVEYVPYPNTAGSQTVTCGFTAPPDNWGIDLVAFSPAEQSGSLVQSTSNTLANGNSYNAISTAFSQNTLPGDAIVLAVFYANATATVTVTDMQGNQYQSATVQETEPSGVMKGQLWYATNIVGGADTITVSFSNAVDYIRVGGAEYVGLTGLDVGAAANGDSTTAAVSLTTTGANEMLVDLLVSYHGESAGDANWQFIDGIAALGGPVFEDREVGTAGTYTGTATNQAGTDQWLAVAAAFRSTD